jgi:hypothetical protein
MQCPRAKNRVIKTTTTKTSAFIQSQVKHTQCKNSEKGARDYLIELRDVEDIYEREREREREREVSKTRMRENI